MKLAASVLKDAGYEDPAFYFEQLTDHMSSGKPLPLTEQDMIRALGVQMSGLEIVGAVWLTLIVLDIIL